MQQAINRAFDIIEFVGSDPETPRSFSEIASNVGLNTGTCANIILALVKRGFLEKLDDKKGYLLGRKIYQLTNFDGYKKELIKIASPILEKLTEKVSENTLLSVLKGNSRIVLLQFQSKQTIQAVSSVDKLAYDSSTGRLLIAMLPDEELNNYISNYGLPNITIWKEASTEKGLLKQISQIRKQGYAIQESQTHISGLAVGIYQKDKIIAAISVYLPSFRFAGLDKIQLIRELENAASEISSRLLSQSKE